MQDGAHHHLETLKKYDLKSRLTDFDEVWHADTSRPLLHPISENKI